jgi:hypothetical protein
MWAAVPRITPACVADVLMVGETSGLDATVAVPPAHRQLDGCDRRAPSKPIDLIESFKLLEDLHKASIDCAQRLTPYFTHGGANEGFQCDLVAYESGDGVVIMTNSDSGGQLATEILRTIAHEYGWPDFQPAENSISKVDDPKVLARRIIAGRRILYARELALWGMETSIIVPGVKFGSVGSS